MTQDWRDVPFSKGFVLTQQDLEQVAHFFPKALPSGWTLWMDEVVPTEYVFDAEDFVVIRGHWIDTSEDAEVGATAKQLLESLLQEGELGFHRRMARFGGRFVVIVQYNSNTWVYNDATGLRSVYYHRVHPLIASHLHLLTSLAPEDRSYTAKATMRAMDATPYASIRQLLPNFRLDPVVSTVERFFPLEANRFLSISPSERLAIVEKIWGRVMDYFLRHEGKLALSITGGLDSKLMLAMCGDNSNLFHAYTYGVTNTTNKSSESLQFDIEQVQSMLPFLKFKLHDFIDITNRQPIGETLKKVIQTNTWGHHGPYLVPIYRDLFPGDGWFHLRGTGVEIIRRYWPTTKTDLQALLRPLRNSDGPPLEERAKALGYDRTHHNYNLMDLIYWEIRMGKWHAEILNEQDAAFETFLPMSVRDIYEVLLSFPEHERENAHAVWELINRNNPILNFWGANDRRNLYEQWRDDNSAIEKGYKQASHSETPLHRSHIQKDVPHSLKKEDFRQGRSSEAEIFTTPSPGSLSFSVDQPYRKPQGVGYFEWQIRLDNEPVLQCDGAVSKTPSNVTLWNLPAHKRVDVSLVALRDGPEESDSWERASKMLINSITFYEGSVDGDGTFMVGCDNPYAINLHQIEYPGCLEPPVGAKQSR